MSFSHNIEDVVQVIEGATSVAVLATLVVIRIVLSWSLAVEIDGVWPWKRRQSAGSLEDLTDSP